MYGDELVPRARAWAACGFAGGRSGSKSDRARHFHIRPRQRPCDERDRSRRAGRKMRSSIVVIIVRSDGDALG
jgi:hypothetical protein